MIFLTTFSHVWQFLGILDIFGNIWTPLAIWVLFWKLVSTPSSFPVPLLCPSRRRKSRSSSGRPAQTWTSRCCTSAWRPCTLRARTTSGTGQWNPGPYQCKLFIYLLYFMFIYGFTSLPICFKHFFGNINVVVVFQRWQYHSRRFPHSMPGGGGLTPTSPHHTPNAEPI